MAQTYNQIYMNARHYLRSLGVEQDRLEATELICLASGKDRNAFQRDRNLYASTEIEQKMNDLLARRAKGEPVPYILGEWDFYGLTLRMSDQVLIPRADTEVLAERTIRAACRVRENCRILDLCAGTGCVGLAAAAHVRGCRVVLADISDEAHRLERENIRRIVTQAQVSAVQADALQPPPAMLGTFDVIACNPPYIRSGDIPTLDVSVRDYEPHLALDGGEDGLVFYRAVTKNWKSLLRPGGTLLYEVGYDQAQDVAAIMEENGFTGIRFTKDPAGIDRVVEGVLEG